MNEEEKTLGEVPEVLDASADMSWWGRIKVWAILKLLGGEMCIANANIAVVYMLPVDEDRGCLILNSKLGILPVTDPLIMASALGDDGK